MYEQVIPSQRESEVPDAIHRILDAAESAFRRTGYAATSLRGIALEAGVSKSLVLYHFQTKEQLFVELQLRVYERLAASIRESAAASDAAPRERALAAFDALVATLAERNDLATYAALGASALGDDTRGLHFRRLRSELRNLLEDTMHRIVEPDALPMPVADAADLVWATITGLALQSVLDGPERVDRGFSGLRTLLSLALREPRS